MWHRHDSIIRRFKWYYSNNGKSVSSENHRSQDCQLQLSTNRSSDTTPFQHLLSYYAWNDAFHSDDCENGYHGRQPQRFIFAFAFSSYVLFLFCCFCVNASRFVFYVSFVFCVIIESDHLLHILRFFCVFSLCVLISRRFVFLYFVIVILFVCVRFHLCLACSKNEQRFKWESSEHALKTPKIALNVCFVWSSEMVETHAVR